MKKYKLESEFQSDLIDELYKLFPGCIILKNDTSYIQGFPDLTILTKFGWAVLECKRSINEPYRPNQEHYLDICDEMAFGSMICPENRKAVLYELQHSFEAKRLSCLSRR